MPPHTAGARARQGYRALAASAVALATLAGCTFLISFDDAPRAEAEADAESPARADVTNAPDVEVVDAGPSDAPKDIDLAEVTSCVGMSSGLYCGNNQIKNYPGSKDDLVACDGGKVASVKACTTGVGCIHMPNPKPDQCDECARKPVGGFYCGRDMYQWVAENKDVRVQCMAGSTVDTTLCATCTSKDAASTCP
jgi:hypothetical protein